MLDARLADMDADTMTRLRFDLENRLGAPVVVLPPGADLHPVGPYVVRDRQADGSHRSIHFATGQEMIDWLERDKNATAAASHAAAPDLPIDKLCSACGRFTCNGSCKSAKSHRAKLLTITPQLVLNMLSGMTPTDEPGRMERVCYRSGGDDLPAGAVCEAVRVNDRGDIEMRVEHDSFPVHEPGMMLDPVEPQYSAIDVPWSLLTLVRDMPISVKELLNAAAESLDRYATDRNAYAKAAAMCRDAAERSVKPVAIEPLGPSPLFAAPPAFAAKEAMDRALQAAFGVPSQQVTGSQEVLFLGGPVDGRRKMVAAPLPRRIGSQFGTYEFTGGLAAGAFVYSFCDDTRDNIEAVKRVEKMVNQAISERHGPFADVASLVPGVDYAKTAEPTPQVRGQHDGRTITVADGVVQADEPTHPKPAFHRATAHDDNDRCCFIPDGRTRCERPAEFWVGKNGRDDYTHVCALHLKDVQRDDDVVEQIVRVRADEPSKVKFREFL